MRVPGSIALLALVSGCVTTGSPPPSALANAMWWNGTEFERGTRWVRDDHFVTAPSRTSETIDLGGSFVMPADDNACGLVPPCRADARITRGDPRLAGSSLIMDLVGGRPSPAPGGKR